MPGSKVLTDVIDPDVPDPLHQAGNTTREGVGGTIGVDVQEHMAYASAAQVAITGSVGGTSGSVGAGGLTGAGTHQGVSGNLKNFGSLSVGKGRLEIKDPFLLKWLPLYHESIQLHEAVMAKDKTLQNLYQQQKIINALAQKALDDGSFWGNLENLLTNPQDLIAIAALPVTFGASSAVLAKQLVKDINSSMSAQQKHDKLVDKSNAIERQIRAREHSIGTYKPFDVDNVDITNPPAGTIYFPAGHAKGVVGKGPLPEDFLDWFKRKKKMLGQVGHHIRFGIT